MSVRQVSRIALALLLAAAGGARAADDPLSTEVQGVFERCGKAVVKIEAEDDHGRLSGTGFFVDPNGTLYTCYSVGGESHDIVVSNGELKYPATRLAADSRSGIAILKVQARKTPFLPLGKSTALGLASVVVTIGYPLDLPVTPQVGCVGGFGISFGARNFAVSHIRASVPAQRGEGGAPLLNMDGEAVGILVSSLDGGAGCFALPVEAAEKVRSDVMRFGQVRPGWLGVVFGEAGGTEPPSSVVVKAFVAGSPAAQAGLQTGDLLLQIGDRKIQTPDDVRNAAFYMTAGDPIPLIVSRAGNLVNLNVQPIDNPLQPPGDTAPSPEQTASLPNTFDFTVRIRH